MSYIFSKKENKIRNWWAILFVVLFIYGVNHNKMLMNIIISIFYCAIFYCSFIKHGIRLLTVFICFMFLITVIPIGLTIFCLIDLNEPGLFTMNKIKDLNAHMAALFAGIILIYGLISIQIILSFKLRKINKKYQELQQKAA
jgi:hypothetical protein